jgi:hypothetical protein
MSSRVESRRDEQTVRWGLDGRTDKRNVLQGGSIFLMWLLKRNNGALKPRPLLDLNNSALNCDRYCMRRINHDVQVHPPASARLYKSFSSCPGCTRLETICPGTSKLSCWRVQLSTASKVGRRGAGSATANIEASLLAGDISHPPAQMVPFVLADKLCRPPA